ncbi:MAG: helix-turn-helix domain-containing protein [Actinomycetota bacterium]|nr:helix-turn-helix domain-containing protein [Actinomycetota bacterium]
MPTAALVRRRDAVEVIGTALVAKAAGHGHCTIAARLGVPVSTVRGWLRRFAARAEQLRAAATRWANCIDAGMAPLEPRGSPFAEALDALGAAASAAIRRLGPASSPWHLLAALTGGLMLAPKHLPLP